MKKKIFSFVLALCLILPCAILLTGCGEQFIEERDDGSLLFMSMLYGY